MKIRYKLSTYLGTKQKNYIILTTKINNNIPFSNINKTITTSILNQIIAHCINDLIDQT